MTGLFTRKKGNSNIWNWMVFFKGFTANPWVRGILLTLYYLVIIATLILMYGKGDFSTPEFIYQGF